MKRLIGIVSIVLFFEQALYAQISIVPPGARFEISSDRPQYLLGEDAHLTFTMVNGGNKPIQIWDGDGWGYEDPRLNLTGISADGSALPRLDFPGFIDARRIRPATIAPGDHLSITVDLSDYCWVDEPGTYTITAKLTQDFIDPPTTQASDPPLAQCKLLYQQATPEQAKKIFDNAVQSRDLFTSLRPMHQAVYVPFLLSLVHHSRPEDYMPALSACYFPEVTLALIRVVDESDGDECERALRALDDRLPGRMFPDLLRQIPSGVRSKVVSRAWRADMTPLLRRAAIKHLLSSDDSLAADSAETIEEIGEPADGPAFIAAVDHCLQEEILLLPSHEKRWKPNLYVTACVRLINQGYEPPAQPKTFGEIALYLETLKTHPAFRHAGWQGLCAGWSASPSPIIRALTLTAQPAPLCDAMAARLPEMITDPDTDVAEAACDWVKKEKHPAAIPAVLKLLATTNDDHLLRSAFEAALANEARFDALQVAADRVGDERCDVLLCEVVVHGGGNRAIRPADPSEIPALKTRWHLWLTEHRAEISAGKQFVAGDPALPRDLFPRDFQVHLPDGTFWPLRD